MLRIHRMAHWLAKRGVPWLPRLLYLLNRVVFAVVLPPGVEVGRNVLFGYSGLGTVVHARCRIGDGASIGAKVTLGGRSGHYEVPRIAEGALIGTGACILGPVTIGRFARVGANAVVLIDVPDHATAIGVPARIVTAADAPAAELEVG